MAGLHIAYRPQEFDEIVGNEKTVSSVKNILRKENKPHVFLFTGPAGTGKSTLGRIVAKELGCSDIDCQEMDIGDFRGIDAAREIRRNMHLKPMGGDCRVWILDEIHRATSDFQSALLKTLEDTPSHVYFVLCTTDPEKLLDTIRSRCTTFTTSLLSEDQIKNLLAEIIDAEGASVPERIVDLIAERSGGQPRHALVELDKIIGLADDDMESALSEMDSEYAKTIDLCRALVEKKPWLEVLAIIDTIKDEPERTKQAILGYFKKVIGNKNRDTQNRAYLIMQAFVDRSFFYSGKYALIVSCYEALYAE